MFPGEVVEFYSVQLSVSRQQKWHRMRDLIRREAQVFSWMKPNAVIVNTACSELIDEKAPSKALQENKIQGAVLDVFGQEPLSLDHPFIKLDNVTITPHLAGSTIDAFRNSTKQMAAQIKAALNNRKELPIVNNVPLSINAKNY